MVIDQKNIKTKFRYFNPKEVNLKILHMIYQKVEYELLQQLLMTNYMSLVDVTILNQYGNLFCKK